MTPRPLHHVGIAVPSLGESIPTFEALGHVPAGAPETVASQGVEVVFLGEGPGRVELIAPTDPASPVARFLERRGPGLHHLCYEVPDLLAALQEAEAAGFELIDRAPRPGARGHRVAFLHPRSAGGVLTELLEV